MGKGRALELLSGEGFSLLVSLPANSAELARAAVNGGAQGLKVHINVEHAASGTRFGSLVEERGNLEAILAEVDVPVGIVPGAETMASPEDMQALAQMGLDFYDAYAHHMPAWMLAMADNPMSVMVALHSEYDLGDRATLVEGLRGVQGARVEMIEASVIPHEGYGKPLSVLDLACYHRIGRLATVPVIVPTQRAIRPEEVGLIRECGMAGLLIGAIVTGRDAASIEKVTCRFRAAIERLQ
jgi:hypothetical protein